MITLPAITFHIWLCKDSTYGRVSIFPNLYDNEVPQTGKITNGLWRSDPTTETQDSVSPSKANNASKKAKGLFHGNDIALKLTFKMITLIDYEGVKLEHIPTKN